MHFFVGLTMFFVGLWLIRRTSARIPSRQATLASDLQLAELEYKLAQKRAETVRLELRMRKQELRLNEHGPAELSHLVAEDAINRERRAKAALTAVLRSNGCDEDQIEDVLSRVDGDEV